MRAPALGLVAILLSSIWTATAHTKPSLLLHINSDASIDIEGRHYVGDSAIKAKLEELRDRKPAPDVRLDTNKTVDYKSVARVLNIAQKVGGLHLGFVGASQQP